ncbi:reprolysin-like metallopeptidase [uncultured Lacinutrix sp.]|uniref:reprolysin-like metallopeptidase n=1 Tax=uncultured Lacinutrix sp. TaxID=574032 RepID=UPI0026235D7A|nr:zinc-dependent metalloprotease family protein [uncultured Lacinutrix sp.]
MKKKYFKSFFLFFVVMFSLSLYAQKQSAIWSQVSANKISANDVQFYKEIPQKSTFFNVNVEQLSNILVNAPKRDAFAKVSNLTALFPNADGKLESFRISEVSVMEPSLEAQFPEIKSYVGVGIENPSAMLRLTISPEKGLSGMILSEKKTVFIEPYSNDLKTYISFINSEGDNNTENFVCETESVLEKSGVSDEEYRALRNADDGQLRTYRLALACTGEYAAFHGGTTAAVMAAMNVTINRNNGIYERDLGLTMIMVDNTSIIFLNGATDPYTNNNGGTMLGENQTVCDTNIGTANYDIGHVFSTGGGGVAYLNSPCTNIKAGGVTGLGAPIGDAFDVDFVAHELGHQFGGNHTQNNNCQRSAVSVEPGSASSIMGYAGICAPNVQNNSDDYFHGENIKEMWLNISVGNSSSCPVLSASGNTAPTASAGADYSIPPSTAFKLTGVGTDADAGNSLTYSWEQNDTTPAPMPPQATNTGGPTFRSLDPKTVPERYFPDFATVLGGSLASTWEVVPSVARTMSFLFTVRDNAPVAGNTQSDEMVVTVENVAPFTVVTPTSWGPGSTQTVIWTVGQTDNVTINCQTVNILFSADGGNNFDTTLATGVPNNGTASITVPSIPLNNSSRILVEAADNIFYAITDVFPLSDTTTPDFNIISNTGAQSACNIDAVSYDFNYITSNGFSETTTLTAAGQPAGSTVTFTPSTLSTDGAFTMDVTGLTGATPGDYTITVTATSPSVVKTETVMLTLTNGVCASSASNADDDRITRVIFNTINNVTLAASADDPYQDFTAISTDVERGSSHDMTVHVNSNGDFPYVISAWIDWDQSCTFDADEKYNLGTAINVVDVATSDSPYTIMVPTDAVLGSTTMRIMMKNEQIANVDSLTPCETAFWGQVEDYSVNVLEALSVNEFELNNLSIYPNPNNGAFNVKFNTTSSNIDVAVFDIRGRSIIKNSYSNTSGEFNKAINLGNVESGMYLLNINDGSKTITKKIIVE